ncbi:hypothetical protein Bhyg_08938, partial [Pseudolycoriella hygida]
MEEFVSINANGYEIENEPKEHIRVRRGLSSSKRAALELATKKAAKERQETGGRHGGGRKPVPPSDKYYGDGNLDNIFYTLFVSEANHCAR